MKGRVELDVFVACSPEDGYKCNNPGAVKSACNFMIINDPYSVCFHLNYSNACSCHIARAAADQLYQQQQKEGEV